MTSPIDVNLSIKEKATSFGFPSKEFAPILVLLFDIRAIKLLVNEMETVTGTITTSKS